MLIFCFLTLTKLRGKTLQDGGLPFLSVLEDPFSMPRTRQALCCCMAIWAICFPFLPSDMQLPLFDLGCSVRSFDQADLAVEMGRVTSLSQM